MNGRKRPIADIRLVKQTAAMKWISLLVGILLAVVGMFAFPSPLPSTAMGVITLGLLLMIDSGWAMGGLTLWYGLESHKEEIEADFYDIEHAQWRYLLAVVIAAANVCALSFTNSEDLRTFVNVSGFVLFVALSFLGIIRARKRASSGHRRP